MRIVERSEETTSAEPEISRAPLPLPSGTSRVFPREDFSKALSPRPSQLPLLCNARFSIVFSPTFRDIRARLFAFRILTSSFYETQPDITGVYEL